MKRRRWLLLSVAVVAVAVCLIGACAFVQMPGRSFSGPLPAATAEEEALAVRLVDDVKALASDIGERHFALPDNLKRASSHVHKRFAGLGYDVVTQTFTVSEPGLAGSFDNLQVEVVGSKRPEEIVVIGAHYDTAMGSPGANDNGSGMAVLFALAEAAKKQQPERTVRFVAFANEEPPFFDTPDMGSRRYAQHIKARGDRVVAMLSLETMGCYSDVEGSQRYPFPFDLVYPSTGNFIAFVGDLSALSLAHQVVGTFREHARFPSQGAAVPASIPGVDWSDHSSFSAIGVPALMVTDTALFRYQSYHMMTDLAVHVDGLRLARVTRGLEAVVDDLARAR